MATEIDAIYNEKEGQGYTEVLVVTIALEEYRSLVKENAQLNERVTYLENRLLEEMKRSDNNAE